MASIQQFFVTLNAATPDLFSRFHKRTDRHLLRQAINPSAAMLRSGLTKKAICSGLFCIMAQAGSHYIHVFPVHGWNMICFPCWMHIAQFCPKSKQVTTQEKYGLLFVYRNKSKNFHKMSCPFPTYSNIFLHKIIWHIGAETKWPLFWWQYLQINYLAWKRLCFDLNVLPSKPALVQIMAWHQRSVKRLSEPMMV